MTRASKENETKAVIKELEMALALLNTKVAEYGRLGEPHMVSALSEIRAYTENRIAWLRDRL